MKTKNYRTLANNDIIIWNNAILKVTGFDTSASNYSIRFFAAALGKNGRFGKKETLIRIWTDDEVPVANSIKEARALLLEISKPEEELPFFVYGTLRKGMGNYESYLIGNTKAEMPATVQGKLWHQGSIIPYMTKGDGVVHGELMYITDGLFPDVLIELDRLEGYRKEAKWNHYNRERVMATLEDGSQVEAYAYYCGGEFGAGLQPIVSGDYKQWMYSFGYVTARRRKSRA